VLTVALALCAYGVTTLVGGSGFLAVYLAAILIGNADIPFRAGILRVHDSLAWLSQVVMFLMLGLLAFPSRIVPVAWVGIALSLLLAFVVRPVVVVLCLLPFRYGLREIVYIAWVGLRGAVPIILATMPVLAGVRGGQALFHLVFFVVVVGSLVPGATVPRVTRWLGLLSKRPAPSDVILEITSTRVLAGDVLPFVVDAATVVAGAAIEDLPLPEKSSVMLVVRGDEMLAPRGGMVLQPGDEVYLFCRPEDQALVRLLFGRATED
jgi:cell volume regulation protein A